MHWFQFWLILHILAVLVAFGPTFAFGLIASLIRRNPQHAGFGTEIMDMIEKRMTLPLAVLVPVFGTALIFTGHVDLWKSEWLLISIVLYMGAFFFALLVQTPNTTRMLKAIRSMPAPAPGGAPPAGGPPPEIAALGKKLQFGGIYLSISIVAVLILMIWNPGASFS
jgi:uncharacterized membrane protein